MCTNLKVCHPKVCSICTNLKVCHPGVCSICTNLKVCHPEVCSICTNLKVCHPEVSSFCTNLKVSHPEVCSICTSFRFRGRGQRDTPVTDARGAVQIALVLPGVGAARVRREAAGLLVRYLGGGPISSMAMWEVLRFRGEAALVRRPFSRRRGACSPRAARTARS